MGHILVVDDDPAMLQLIRRVLEKDQHLISLISDARTALNMNFSKYDLILLDIMMPGLDGFEFCSQIRSCVDCPIIFLTAKIQEADIVRGLGLGADDYITKPFGTDELRARVNAHLRRDTREKKNAFSISGIVFQINAKEAEFQGEKLPLTKVSMKSANILHFITGKHLQGNKYMKLFLAWTGKVTVLLFPPISKISAVN